MKIAAFSSGLKQAEKTPFQHLLQAFVVILIGHETLKRTNLRCNFPPNGETMKWQWLHILAEDWAHAI